MNNRKVGTEKEEKAIEFLEKSGMHILEKNFRCRQGEIDIIGIHKGYLTFVEVKYRKNSVFLHILFRLLTKRRIYGMIFVYRFL